MSLDADIRAAARSRLAPPVGATLPAACGIDPEAPLPFEEILAPLVAQSLDELERDATPWFSALAAEARAALARSLLLDLVGACAPTLLAAFDKRRPAGIALLARLLDGEARLSDSDAGSARYDAFVAEMVGGGFDLLLGDYPVLAKIIATLRRNFHGRLIEFAARLDADLPAIIRAFGWNAAPGRIVALKPSLSDPHRDGRTVMLVRFESGAALVYKPRSVEMEAAFQSLWRMCDDQAPAFAVLARDGYGWAEAIAPALPQTPEEWERLSLACGRLLALLYLLGATDCHFENLIIRGDQILLIDAETALQPALPCAISEGACLGDPWLWDSVRRPGMLPTWTFGTGGKGACDIGALGQRDSLRGAFLMPRWRAINTDAMTFGTEPAQPAEAPQLAIDAEALIRGFSGMCRRLLAERDGLVASPVLRALESARLRFIVRDTFLYANLLRTGLDPAHLVSEEAQRAHLDHLPAAPGDGPEWQAIRRAELAALERRDIPYFAVEASERVVTGCQGSAVHVPQLRPAFPDMLQRFAQLSEAGIRRQEALIRASFTAARVTASADHVPLPYPDPVPPVPVFLPAAFQLADQLVAGAMPGADGALHWLELWPAGLTDCYLPRRIGWSLYAGNGGIALFLAAASAASGRRDLREAAYSALAPLRAAAPPGREARLTGTGIGQGTGSLLYALTRCAGFLRDDTLLDDALRIADRMDAETFAREPSAELLSGSAGAIIALLALHDATGQADLIDKAELAGRYLLERWEAPPRLTGASHGASGFALAFARLGAATGATVFRQAVHDALAFERATFDDEAGGWPDFRFPAAAGKPPCSTMWCHGAPGIGLVRLALAGSCDDPLLRDEVETALAATLAYGLQPVDGLCCGNFGRIDFLVEAARLLDRPDLHDMAAAAAAARLALRQTGGGFLLDGNDAPDQLKPSLFTGIAGIGYTLLRLADPGATPTVLTWN